jgi:hypothetical protein
VPTLDHHLHSRAVNARSAQLAQRPSAPPNACPALAPPHGTRRLFTLLRNIEDFFPCTLADNGLTLLPPAGWELQSYLYLQEDLGSGEVNFGSIIYNPGTRQVVVAIRGTQTPPEWLLDWQYNQVCGCGCGCGKHQ